MNKNKLINCPCCGSTKFTQKDILWLELVKEWDLSDYERKYIDKQQGYTCYNCGSNLRSMSLAMTMKRYYEHNGSLESFVKKYRKKLAVLEINEAGQLHTYLDKFIMNTLAVYPDVNMEKLPYRDGSYDVVIHSDTLEHIVNPVVALKESYRVLKSSGVTFFTIPIIVDRLSRNRKNKPNSYHGSKGNDEYLVVTEYGADMWRQVIEAGFTECRIVSYCFPESIVLVGIK